MGSIRSDYFLSGKLLLAMPMMGDTRFHRAVIFICSHDENGAMGLMINHMLPELSFQDLLGQLKIQSDIKIDLQKQKFPIMNGGPVDSARGFILHSPDFRRMETTRIGDSYGLTGTIDAVRDIIKGEGPEKLLFILGYAGWTAGQLEHEIQQNSWLVVDPDPSIIFHTTPEEKWDMAIHKLGVNPAMLSASAGRA